jgi:hypothetical protein
MPAHLTREALGWGLMGQTVFKYTGFDEVKRLGLREETEVEVRKQAGSGVTGMLVVESVVPGGPAHNVLEAGDLMVSLNGNVLYEFLSVRCPARLKVAPPPQLRVRAKVRERRVLRGTRDGTEQLEQQLDDNVGGEVTLCFERGGEQRQATVRVDCLHGLSPARFLEVCSGVVHPLSYQQARNFCSEVGSVYVAEPGNLLGHANVPKHAIITSLNRVATPDVDAFAAVWCTLQPGARVLLQVGLLEFRLSLISLR